MTTRDDREKLLSLAKKGCIAWDSLAHELLYFLSPSDFVVLNRETGWLDIEDDEEEE